MGELTDFHGSNELLGAQTLLWSHIFNHIDSMSLKCAMELGIPDAIHRHGKPLSLPDLLSALSISHTKGPSMRRLMRMLTHSGIFTCSSKTNNGEEEEVYSLSPLSTLLVDKKCSNLSGFLVAMLHPVMVNPFQSMAAWFRGDGETAFSLAHGCHFWEMTDSNPEFNKVLNEAMASDAQFVMNIVLTECRQVFEGVTSMIDVGGGTGSAAIAIAEAFPDMKCSVLELPQVVGDIHSKEKVDFIAGDMFDYVPPADAVMLKWILHDWGDEDCVKILRRCKESIPSKEDGGKVIIIDMVVGSENSLPKSRETQLFMDMMMMVLCGGVERKEEQWKMIFMEAGFADYKLTPALGPRSIIEVYP